MVGNRRAPEAVLVALAEAVDKWARASEYFDGDNEVSNMLRAYRAAVAPLRTRSEVDAEIVALMREADEPPRAAQVPINPGLRMRLTELLRETCSEPTVDETEPESIEDRHKRMNTAGMLQMCDTIGKKWAKEREPNATTDHDDRPCGCEEAEALNRKLADLETELELWEQSAKGATATLSAIGLILREP